jgi:hypothetical protein
MIPVYLKTYGAPLEPRKEKPQKYKKNIGIRYECGAGTKQRLDIGISYEQLFG